MRALWHRSPEWVMGRRGRGVNVLLVGRGVHVLLRRGSSSDGLLLLLEHGWVPVSDREMDRDREIERCMSALMEGVTGLPETFMWHVDIWRMAHGTWTSGISNDLH